MLLKILLYLFKDFLSETGNNLAWNLNFGIGRKNSDVDQAISIHVYNLKSLSLKILNNIIIPTNVKWKEFF